MKKDSNAESLTELTRDMHFYPDLHGKLSHNSDCLCSKGYIGNRSPIADPRMRGSFVGLTLVSFCTHCVLLPVDSLIGRWAQRPCTEI